MEIRDQYVLRGFETLIYNFMYITYHEFALPTWTATGLERSWRVLSNQTAIAETMFTVIDNSENIGDSDSVPSNLENALQIFKGKG